MRLHRHQVGREKRWHSVRTRHDENAWDWCAHHEEVMSHLSQRQCHANKLPVSKQLRLQPAR